jgi:hypothetical protein
VIVRLGFGKAALVFGLLFEHGFAGNSRLSEVWPPPRSRLG